MALRLVCNKTQAIPVGVSKFHPQKRLCLKCIKLLELTIYKKSTVESATLSFWVCSFFKYFDERIIDTLSDIVGSGV